MERLNLPKGYALIYAAEDTYELLDYPSIQFHHPRAIELYFNYDIAEVPCWNIMNKHNLPHVMELYKEWHKKEEQKSIVKSDAVKADLTKEQQDLEGIWNTTWKDIIKLYPFKPYVEHNLTQFDFHKESSVVCFKDKKYNKEEAHVLTQRLYNLFEYVADRKFQENSPTELFSTYWEWYQKDDMKSIKFNFRKVYLKEFLELAYVLKDVQKVTGEDWNTVKEYYFNKGMERINEYTSSI